jgi:hypothetical protein
MSVALMVFIVTSIKHANTQTLIKSSRASHAQSIRKYTYTKWKLFTCNADI